MGQWLTESEKAAREELLALEREAWAGVVLDYGHFTRTVFDVEWDEAGDRLILCARAEDEDGYVPEPASEWEEPDVR